MSMDKSTYEYGGKSSHRVGLLRYKSLLLVCYGLMCLRKWQSSKDMYFNVDKPQQVDFSIPDNFNNDRD